MWYSEGFNRGRWGYDAKPPNYEPERSQYMDGYIAGVEERKTEAEESRKSYW